MKKKKPKTKTKKQLLNVIKKLERCRSWDWADAKNLRAKISDMNNQINNLSLPYLETREAAIASQKGDKAGLVKYLKRYGTYNINQKLNMELTALNFATAHGQIEIVKFLLKNGAIVDDISLSYATIHKRDAILALLEKYKKRQEQTH